MNGVQLRGCEIRYCGPKIRYGIFSAKKSKDGRYFVPLDLAITPMRVLQDPILGPKCRAMLDGGDVDDRFLMILFLTLERLRKDSTWKPYLDMLPTTFGNPLWFTDDELLELKGTTLYRATELQMYLIEDRFLSQKKSLQAMFEDKVKHLIKELLPLEGESESDFLGYRIAVFTFFDLGNKLEPVNFMEVCFEDFLWANSIFWTRALNIPLPRSHSFREEREVTEKQLSSPQLETVWVEGLVPGIDFCNHEQVIGSVNVSPQKIEIVSISDLRAAATWEIDGTGSTTGTAQSMYLLSGIDDFGADMYHGIDDCLFVNGGAVACKPELLYLYGFVIDNNPDDYLMLHYPIEAFSRVPFSDSKAELLDIQKAEMRCLLPRRLLEHGFFSTTPLQEESNTNSNGRSCNYSWSGQRKVPSYLSKLVFPEDFLAALRTIAMQESELLQVLSLLEELVGLGEERQPSDTEVRAAVWEACGDSGTLQLLVDLLSAKMMELEEGTGTEVSDADLLEKALVLETVENVRYANFLARLSTGLKANDDCLMRARSVVSVGCCDRAMLTPTLPTKWAIDDNEASCRRRGRRDGRTDAIDEDEMGSVRVAAGTAVDDSGAMAAALDEDGGAPPRKQCGIVDQDLKGHLGKLSDICLRFQAPFPRILRCVAEVQGWCVEQWKGFSLPAVTTNGRARPPSPFKFSAETPSRNSLSSFPPQPKKPIISSSSSPSQKHEPATITTAPHNENQKNGRFYNVKFQSLRSGKLGISRYPDFEYNAHGGVGTGTGQKQQKNASDASDDQIAVSFDVQSLYIPALTGETTRFLGLPLPPFLKIDILPQLFQGTINQDSGQVDLEFKAKFLFSIGSIYRAPPLLVSTVLTSEESVGKIRGGRGERLSTEGRCRLVGVATVDPINDILMDSFLGLPTECLADLNAIISISTSE
ncbi:hypothetical protein ACLOJK_005163 [Asimina triloba]